MGGHPFVGRGVELEVGRTMLADAMAGNTVTMLVTGDAGVGKSSLVRQLATDAVEGGFFAAIGHSSEPTTGVRFAPLRGVARDLARAGRSRSTGSSLLQRLSSPGCRGELEDVEAIIDGLVEVSDDTPLLVVLEDLHWADRSTVDFSHHLARTLREAPLLLIATVRTEAGHLPLPNGDAFLEMQRLASVRRQHLGELTRIELRRLARLVTRRHLSEQEAEQLFAATGGNALLVTELLRLPSSEWDLRSAAVADIVQGAIDALPAASRLTIATASLTPLDIDPGFVASAQDDAIETVEKHLRDATALGVLEHDGDRIRFRHSLLADAARRELSPDAVTRLHGLIADRLLSTGSADAAELAHHLEFADRAPDAFDVSVRAAGAAAGDFGRGDAVPHYERALRLLSLTDVGRESRQEVVDLANAALECAFYVGDTVAAERYAAIALQACDAVRDSDRWIVLTCRASELAWQNGSTERSLALLTAAEDALDSTSSPIARAHVFERRAFHASMAGDGIESLRLATQAQELAHAGGDLTLGIEALLRVGLAQSMSGDFERGVATLRDARRRAADAGHHRSVIRATINLTALHVGSGELNIALTEAAVGEGLAERLGAPLAWQTHAIAWRIVAYVGAGDLHAAAQLLGEAISPPAASFTSVLDIAGAELALAAGDLDEARRLVERVHIEPQDHLGWWLRHRLILHSVAFADGNTVDRDDLDLALDLAEFWPDSLLLQLSAVAVAAIPSAESERLGRLLARADARAQSLARGGRSVDSEAWWLLVQARYAERTNRDAGAAYLAAARAFARCGRPNDEGWALIAACRDRASAVTPEYLAQSLSQRSTRPPSTLLEASADLTSSSRNSGAAAATADDVIRFREFELDGRRFELRHRGHVVPVEPQVLQLLLFMARHPGELLTKQRLLDEIWGDRFVSESALTTRIKTARRVLGDDGARQRFIRTVHRRGYRFSGFE